MSFQTNLKKLREKAGYTSAKDFAKELNIPYTTYINYETKGGEPKFDVLCKIAIKLKTTPDALLGFVEPTDWIERELIPILKGTNFSFIDFSEDGIIIEYDSLFSGINEPIRLTLDYVSICDKFKKISQTAEENMFKEMQHEITDYLLKSFLAVVALPSEERNNLIKHQQPALSTTLTNKRNS